MKKAATKVPEGKRTKAASVVGEFLRVCLSDLRVSKCSICKQTEVAELVAEFQRARKDGRTAIPWSHFCRAVLAPYGIVYETLLNHVRNCLGGV